MASNMRADSVCRRNRPGSSIISAGTEKQNNSAFFLWRVWLWAGFRTMVGGRTMNVLFVALGSAGDVYPSIGLGKELRARGHRATVITNNACETVVRAEGLEYVRLTKE